MHVSKPSPRAPSPSAQGYVGTPVDDTVDNTPGYGCAHVRATLAAGAVAVVRCLLGTFTWRPSVEAFLVGIIEKGGNVAATELKGTAGDDNAVRAALTRACAALYCIGGRATAIHAGAKVRLHNSQVLYSNV